MTELLNRAIEEMFRLPRADQDRLARRLLDEVLPSLGRQPEVQIRTTGSSDSNPLLVGLVGLASGSVGTDAHLDTTRGPAWRGDLDGDP